MNCLTRLGGAVIVSNTLFDDTACEAVEFETITHPNFGGSFVFSDNGAQSCSPAYLYITQAFCVTPAMVLLNRALTHVPNHGRNEILVFQVTKVILLADTVVSRITFVEHIDSQCLPLQQKSFCLALCYHVFVVFPFWGRHDSFR